MHADPNALDRAFVGRRAELATLDAALDDALAGSGRLVLLVGEAGIGKTRTAAECGRRAEARGARVLWARAHDGGAAPPLWMWTQVLRAYRHTGELPAPIARLAAVSEDGPPPAEPSRERTRIFDAVAVFLHDAAARRPLVLVLEDLHAADEASLGLLAFLAGRLEGERLLIVATHREGADELAGLRLLPGAVDLVLPGLAEAEVHELLALAAGGPPSRAVTAAVFRRTAGNAFFVRELARHLAAEGRLLSERAASSPVPLPPSVREMVRRRLAVVSDECRDVLAAAAVLGERFDVALLAELGRPPHVLLDDAVRAGLVRETDRPGCLAFTHALMREGLYEDMAPGARRLAHLRAGEALERRHAASLDEHAAELAHHFFAAMPLGCAETAWRHALAAGARALAGFAPAEAVAHFEQARAALEVCPAPDDGRRCDVLIALAGAHLRAGHADRARRLYAEAADRARAAGLAVRLARAAIGLGTGFGWFWGYGAGTVDELLVRLLSEARALLAPSDSALRVEVLGRLATALYWSEDAERKTEIPALLAEAVAISARLGDPLVRIGALVASHWAGWRPDNLADRLAVATEVIRLARETGHLEAALIGHEYRFVDLLEAGDVTAADRDLESYAQIADALGQPCYRWYTPMFRATRAAMEGRLEDAERLIAEALALGDGAASETVMLGVGGHLYALRRAQGRLAEVEPHFRSFASRYPSVPAWRCGLTGIHAELGHEAEARAEFERLAAHDFTDLPRDNVWLVGVTTLARVNTFLGDRKRARLLYDLLRPHAGQHAVAAVGFFYDGPVSLALGELAAMLGRPADATAHLERARTECLAAGARPFAARVEAALARLAGPRPPSASAAERAPDVGVCHREGTVWTLAYRGLAVRLGDTKGLRHIAHLLGHPGERIDALDLVAALEPMPGAMPPGGPDPILDARARADYRRRLVELRDGLEEAERWNDVGRAEGLRAEMERLAEHVAAATGLGGRSRSHASPTERARLLVRQRIKAALDSIEARHAALGRHLARQLRTGHACAYLPEPDAPVWDVRCEG